MHPASLMPSARLEYTNYEVYFIVKFYHMFGIPIYIIFIIFVILIFFASKRIRGVARKLRKYEDI